MSGYRSYEGGFDHAGKSEFGILLLRLRKRHEETIQQQADRLGFSASYIKMSGSLSGQKTGRPSERLRRHVVESYALTTNEYEAALGREPLGHEGA